jgi:hypothetical protein
LHGTNTTQTILKTIGKEKKSYIVRCHPTVLLSKPQSAKVGFWLRSEQQQQYHATKTIKAASKATMILTLKL